MPHHRNSFRTALLVSFAISLPFSSQAESARSTDISHAAIIPRVAAVKPVSTSISPEAAIDHVVVKFKDDSQVRLSGSVFYSKTGAQMRRVNTVTQRIAPNQIQRLFQNHSENVLDQKRETLTYKSKRALADLNGYYRIDINSVSEAEQLINELNALDEVEIAYLQPKPEPAGFFEVTSVPNYQAAQDYREAAPVGVDADYANGFSGGDGSGVKIIDIEGSWRHNHIDLSAAAGNHIAGSLIPDLSWRNHGTAVLGEMIANDDGQGVTGICPGADVGTVSIGSMSTAEALMTAADNLQPGDAILIELHAPGPHYNFQSRPDQLGYVCMEYWQANFDAIQYCWASGLVVVEAGGNGAENFDNATYYGDLFDTTYRNSHAIIVGAGHPAVDFNDLERESFSNYGERVNLQGYGSDVYTTGYGGLYNGSGVEDSFYTATFSGTSSASPIVTGAVACLQGRYKQIYGVPMTVDQIRKVLVSTGTPQMGNLSEHIGPRPDLEAAFANLNAPPSIYTTPLLLDTTLNEGNTAQFDVWLHNRHTTLAYDFSINDNDSLAKIAVGNWLTATPLAGTIPPLDSIEIDVTFDASVVGDQIDAYKGVLEISWGPSGGSLDSLSMVPAFMTVSCFDTTYSSYNSGDPGGPTFNWISARTLGFKLTNTSYYNITGNPLDDGTNGPHNIGFDFPFFDTTYTRVYIGVNGALSFTDNHVNYNGYFGLLNFPNSDFQTIVSAYWNDLIFDTQLVPSSGIFIYRSPTNDTMVIEWYKPANFNVFGDTLTDFEIILTADGKITMQYFEVGNAGLEQSAVVGISGYQCSNKSHFGNQTPAPNMPADSKAIQFKSNIWDYVWAGDCNFDGNVNILDLTFTVDYIFRGGDPCDPLVLGDANCDDEPLQILDLTYLVDALFRGGPFPCRFILRH